jgi:hypothetical protein
MKTSLPLYNRCAKTSGTPFVSPETRLLAKLKNTTTRPFPEISLSNEELSGWPEEIATLARVIAPVTGVTTKTSARSFVSFVTRFVACE